ncbi:MAG: cob(I)yrinic acid a,c-diamide adenosyltransferase [Polyangiaceae bacterium]|nr:cob(I)yrinic acid a,c-diamide adenosyltransferase [Polyangiaceae bacterium]
MKLYTKTGDSGSTGLFGGTRVDKDDARVDTYGSVDETNASIGVARAAGLPPGVDGVLAEVQSDLFTLGAELACVPGHEARMKMTLIGASDIERLEHAIDAADEGLTALGSFVLPGGTAGAAALHAARTVCRRAERRAVALRRGSPVRDELIVYLNRLSDLLFVLARRANHQAGAADVPWVKRQG